MNAVRRVLTLAPQALWLAACGLQGHVRTAALECGDLGIDVPTDVPPFDDRRGPVPLNEDTVNAVARSLYGIPWQRITRVKVLVQADGRISHACVSEVSLDSAFDRIALKASESARFRPAGGATATPAWTSLFIVAQPELPPATDRRYQPIAFRDTLERRFESEEVLALQAAVLNYLIAHNDAHDQGRPNRGICIGVGPILPVFDPPESLMAHITPTPLPLHAASACVVDRQYPQGWPSRLVLKSSGAAAIALWVDIAEPRSGMAEVRAGYYEGGLSGAHYSCRATDLNSHWTVDTCRVTAIS